MVSEPDELAQAYAAACKQLRSQWYYEEPLGQAEPEVLVSVDQARQALGQLPAEAIDGLAERRSFWINLYNGAVIDLAVTMGVRRTVKEVRGFFRRRRIEVAGQFLSLDEVEHGFLRAGRRHPARLLPPLLLRPHLRSWMALPFDPRIHFALNCGGRSCPPIRFYTAGAIDEDLDLAAAAFLDATVQIDREAATITASPILRWYRADFEAIGGIEGLVRRYRTGGLESRPWRFAWSRYDWDL